MPSEKPSRISSLDGLRAVSLCLVLLGHLAGTRGFLTASAGSALGDVANLGVRVFFAISGFLITVLLIRELDRTGGISLKLFYLRRTVRIFPAFYAFLALMAVASACGWIRLLPGDLLHAVTYTSNYHQHQSWFTGHLWSLSVEEQFYLLWPLVFAFGGLRRATWVAAITMLAAPVCRTLMMVCLPESRYGIGWWFPTIADSIAAGCLLALLKPRLEQNRRYLALLRSPWFFLVLPPVLAMNMYPGGRLKAALLQSLINIILCITIHRVVMMPRTLSGRFLNSGPIAFAGVLSYSVYLWQQPFLNRHSGSLLQSFPLNLLLAIACGIASYYIVERPMLGARKRLEEWFTARRVMRTATPANSAPVPIG